MPPTTKRRRRIELQERDLDILEAITDLRFALIESEYNTLIALAKKVNETLEAEIKEKYQPLKDQQQT